MESSTKLAVLIMATGSGTPLKSRRPTVLHEVGGKPLVNHVIAAAAQFADPTDIYVVVGHQAEQVKAAVSATGVRFIDTAGQRGAGHALQTALEAAAAYEHILLLPGDVPLIRPETIEQLWQFHLAEQAAMTILTASLEDPNADHPNTEKIGSGICAFKTAPLLKHLGILTAAAADRELDLTDLAAQLRTNGQRVVAFSLPGPTQAAEVLSPNSLAELAAIDASLRTAAANRLMAAGVTIFRPETCVIDGDVEVAPDTVIEPFVQLLGSTRIGAECLIRSYSVIENCTLGDNILIRQSCILAESTIEDGAKIGPFAHLRPGSKIGQDAHVGNFVETKKATLGKGAKANHLTYLGDAEVGEGSNIGAGVITCNYDGVNKHRTRIGKGVFVGSDSTLVAPVNVEDGAYIGAGSCITKDVPAGALAVGRARQFTKEGWVAVRRAHQDSKEKKAPN
jgi:bifunctional UDP-N-acetylglucosamine pyrophosphorylase/glucosamine-1-phosphate N-acetyltransferase